MMLRTPSKVPVFLIELTIVLLIFAFTSAIALGLFAKAHQVDVKTSNATMALMKTQTFAEYAKNTATLEEFQLFAGEFDKSKSVVPQKESWPKYFDGDWNPVTEAAAAVFAIESTSSIEKLPSGTMTSMSLSTVELAKVKTGSAPIIKLTVQHYFPK
jgi:type II secretory pathway pseudopilin PulG